MKSRFMEVVLGHNDKEASDNFLTYLKYIIERDSIKKQIHDRIQK
jgi:hypothetical protein